MLYGLVSELIFFWKVNTDHSRVAAMYYAMSCTRRFIYYRKSVLHLLKRMFHIRLSRCSTLCAKLWGPQYSVVWNRIQRLLRIRCRYVVSSFFLPLFIEVTLNLSSRVEGSLFSVSISFPLFLPFYIFHPRHPHSLGAFYGQCVLFATFESFFLRSRSMVLCFIFSRFSVSNSFLLAA